MSWLPLTAWWRPRMARMARALRLRGLAPLMHALARLERDSAAAAHAANDLARLRYEVCRTCPLLTPTGLCDRRRGGCGCYMPVKVRLSGAKCPQGKW